MKKTTIKDPSKPIVTTSTQNHSSPFVSWPGTCTFMPNSAATSVMGRITVATILSVFITAFMRFDTFAL
mgnify:CR=1 FL=1